MLELKVRHAGRSLLPSDLVSVLGRRRAVREIGDIVEYLIAEMDVLAGDPDLEEDDSEDSFVLSRHALRWIDGAGCPLSDPGGADPDEDEPGDLAFSDGPGCRISDPDLDVDDPV